MAIDQADTKQLLKRASRGDPGATGQLLERHRQRLKRAVAVRLDRRLAARLDPSDVVQDTLADAARRLPAYLHDRPMPFYPWLRRLAGDRLAALYRDHVRRGKRSVAREEPPPLPGESSRDLAERLLNASDGPSARLRRRERRDLMRAALERLPDRDREVLVLRQLEELSVAEVAAVLGVSEGAVYVRQLRALRRLREALGPGAGEAE
jgi:RNA polymerase sigma-70 factor (ECF subfamily)